VRGEFIEMMIGSKLQTLEGKTILTKQSGKIWKYANGFFFAGE
jgi:hypothetical protein